MCILRGKKIHLFLIYLCLTHQDITAEELSGVHVTFLPQTSITSLLKSKQVYLVTIKQIGIVKHYHYYSNLKIHVF